MSDQTPLIRDICNKCQKEDENLARPCNNKSCKSRFHQECLNELFNQGNVKCTECEQEIVVSEIRKLKSCGNILTHILIMSIL